MKLLRRLFNKKHENLIDVWHGNQWLKVKESKLKNIKWSRIEKVRNI
ncbi:hypothetical protein [Staphylococcus aureus]|nr:hypothetical protein [Staphylococcus aureus]